MKTTTLIFGMLCLAAYAVQLVECVALNRTGDTGVIVSLDFAGLVLFIALAGWSLANIRHHWIRAVTGVVVCALCILQFVENRQIIW